jgi:hypothetical protein
MKIHPYYGEMEEISVPKRCIPEGAKLVEAYETETEIVVCGQPQPEPEGLTQEQYIEYYETSHNCDQMGCTTVSHVIYRFKKLPALSGIGET